MRKFFNFGRELSFTIERQSLRLVLSIASDVSL